MAMTGTASRDLSTETKCGSTAPLAHPAAYRSGQGGFLINRRAALLSIGAIALGVSRAGRAQPPARVHRVAYASLSLARNAPFFVAMERRFRELGYIEGKNLSIAFRSLDGRWEKLPEIAADLASSKPDVVISPGGERQLRAFRQAMGATPIVMIAVDFDPVERNFIASLSRPGGNITGLFLRQLETAAKRLELLKEALPRTARVAVLFDLTTRDQLQAAAEAAKNIGVTLLPQELHGSSYDFESALNAAAAGNAQAVLVLSSGAFFASRQTMFDAARRRRLPVVANPNFAEGGALISFGPNFVHMYTRAADYADRILKGAKPADMPVEQPTKFELIVNMKTAKTLGIAVPPSLLLRADRVIE